MPPLQKPNNEPAETRLDPEEAAAAARLRYVSDSDPGIHRKKAGKGFTYVAPDGARLTDPKTLERIKALVIPPAWTDVWICPRANGHIQVSGRDQKGRKQYLYHERWREVRDSHKFDRMIAFGEALPGLRKRIGRDLGKEGLRRERVLATVVRLLETTLIRVGNEEYARTNDSYGLTTLRNEHVEVDGTELRFHFRGKSGKACEVDVRDRRLARIVKQCQELPDQNLFEYVEEDGSLHEVGSADVNEYLRQVTGQDFTAKDFRTWAATVMAFTALRDCEDCDTVAAAKRNVVAAVKAAAARLNNTPAVCRKSYIHPAVLETYLDQAQRAVLRDCPDEELVEALERLEPDERAVLAFLRRLNGKKS
jgi:DNA topoisomerase-1